MVKCVNDQCENHDKIIKEHTESCPVCGTQTEACKKPVRTEMGVAAVIMSLAAILLLFSYGMIFYLGFVLAPASIGLSFLSRSKPAIVITFIAVAIFVIRFLSITVLY